ncbi:MAG: DUF4159 domain-containing protein, partial [Phycisphaerae bacterium]
MRRKSHPVRAYVGVALGALLLWPAAAMSGPNLMAIGDYSLVPTRRATGRDSFSGNKIVYSFDEPEFNFGRVVVEPEGPNSVVRRDLFVGFDGNGLAVGRRGGRMTARIANVEIWLRVQGRIRGDRRLAWEADVDSTTDVLGPGLEAVIPVCWADGRQMGAPVTIHNPPPPDDDHIQRLLIPHGEVEVGPFQRTSGGVWVVLEPEDYGGYFVVRRFSLREIETRADLRDDERMPAPVAYVSIRDVPEERLPRVLLRAARTLREAKGEGPFWESKKGAEESVKLTAQVASALAELNPHEESVPPAMEWLAEQQPEEDELWNMETVAQRLYCMARHAPFRDFRRIIHTDADFLINAQLEDGGWSDRSAIELEVGPAIVRSDNDHSFIATRSLREARFAGVEMTARTWRRALAYWSNAQAYDGGYRQRHERFGGLGQATTSAYTAYGAAGLLGSLDMAAGVGGRRCLAYRGSRRQLHAATDALAWLHTNYGEPFRDLGSLVTSPDPFSAPTALEFLGEVSGVSRFNDKDHFAETANSLLKHFDDQSGLFGVRNQDGSWDETPSLSRTARALEVLARGAAPIACQRIVAGDDETDWGQFSGDAVHLVRYLGAQRGQSLNWKRASIGDDIHRLAKVPILILSVLGEFEWSNAQWSKIRAYCLSGGTVVVVFGEEQQAIRKPVIATIRTTFPEYELAPLPPDSPLLSSDIRLSPAPQVQAMGNGFRHFILIPDEDWACHWQLYDTEQNSVSFAFMNNLLTYATDGRELPASYVRSSYPSGWAATLMPHNMRIARIEVGGKVPAYPNLIKMMDRLSREKYRLGITETINPEDADLLWVSVTGNAHTAGDVRSQLEAALKHGTSLFI